MNSSKFIGYIFLFGVLVNLVTSCNSCSRSGRARLVATAMAKKEGNKKPNRPTPNTIKKNIVPQTVTIDDIVSPNENKKISKNLIKNKISPAEGKLIQVEGLVLLEVRTLTIDLNTSSSQIDQIIAMRNHVNANWHYIFDPESSHDTWRSAEATISLKYNGKYSGDCDDFAILMASFARQIGLRSRMVGGYDGVSGHAFAEFFLPKNLSNNSVLKGADVRSDYEGNWVSLDWFKGEEHNRFTQNIDVYENI